MTEFQVLVKTPRNNRLCQKYYTYGKYRDVKEKEWYLWLTEPCRANITTWCRFRDIPLAQAKTKTAWRQENRVQKGLRFEDTQPVRIAVEVQWKLQEATFLLLLLRWSSKHISKFWAMPYWRSMFLKIGSYDCCCNKRKNLWNVQYLAAAVLYVCGW